MRLTYLANIRLPSEKAHTYQIMQTCEAFALAGADVTLLHANRRNTPQLAGIMDIWTHYGVRRNFDRETVPCLDLYRAFDNLRGWPRRIVERFASLVLLVTYSLSLVWRVRSVDADMCFSRDSVPLAALVALRPRLRDTIFFEAHEFPVTRLGRWIRRWLAHRIAGMSVVNQHLATLYIDELGVSPDRIAVVRNGVRLERFTVLGDRASCRAELGLPADAFVVGYVGQLHLMGMSKGVDVLIRSVAELQSEGNDRSLRLCVVGGPGHMVERLRQQATAQGLSDDTLVTPGQVHPDDVPRWMRACDVCTLPSPWTEYFAYYTSPLKLFEYMAAGAAIVASDLPAVREILTDGHSALLTPAGEAAPLTAALRRLRDDPSLGRRLAEHARQEVGQYTWLAKAERLLSIAAERQRQPPGDPT